MSRLGWTVDFSFTASTKVIRDRFTFCKKKRNFALLYLDEKAGIYEVTYHETMAKVGGIAAQIVYKSMFSYVRTQVYFEKFNGLVRYLQSV